MSVGKVMFKKAGLMLNLVTFVVQCHSACNDQPDSATMTYHSMFLFCFGVFCFFFCIFVQCMIFIFFIYYFIVNTHLTPSAWSQPPASYGPSIAQILTSTYLNIL